MKKIPTLFKRDPDNMSRVLPEIDERCAWVAAGEGVATRKYDGTACMIDANGGFWKRRTLKRDAKPPADFIECERDPVTGKVFGWVPVTDEDTYHREAFQTGLAPGTYELLGPKIQGNPEGIERYGLVLHQAAEHLPDCPRTFDELRDYLDGLDIEGVVWHHPDGRMAKIKGRDFGLRRAS